MFLIQDGQLSVYLGLKDLPAGLRKYEQDSLDVIALVVRPVSVDPLFGASNGLSESILIIFWRNIQTLSDVSFLEILLRAEVKDNDMPQILEHIVYILDCGGLHCKLLL